MKVILTVKTGKGVNSTERDIDRTVDELVSIGSKLEEKGYNCVGSKCYCDGTAMILEK